MAGVANIDIDPAPYLVSEKYDGVRALWGGKTPRSRAGNVIAAPAWFIAKLPKQPLDGELWIGRGQFEKLSGAVRKTTPQDDEWRQIKYMIFELPGAPGAFAERYEQIRDEKFCDPTGHLLGQHQHHGSPNARMFEPAATATYCLPPAA